MNTRLVPLRPSGGKRPLFCLFAGDSNFHNFAQCIPDGQPVYAVDMKPFDGRRINSLINELAVQCLDLIRKKQESGPYYLCGYSFGGYVAYEVAVSLLRRGEDIGVLALLDAANPAFRTNLSAVEAARFHGTYFTSRLVKYGRNFLTGDFKALASDAAAFIGPKVGTIWLVRSIFKFLEKPISKIFVHNDPIIVAAGRAYIPPPYTERLVVFRSLARGPEFDRDLALGWDKCATGAIDVHFVPGDHVNMMGTPNVLRLVEMLEPYLDGGQQGRRQAMHEKS
jgi:thioesterase domain-containing protein